MKAEHPTPAKADGGSKISHDQVRYAFTPLPALGCRTGLLDRFPVPRKWTRQR